MTVIYADMMASQGNFGSFWRLLARWRGSVYKMVWQDMLVYTILFYIISLVYRLCLDEQQRTTFEMVVMHCTRFRNVIPVSFVLGFFVSLVVSRWWGMYKSLPWPDTTSIVVATLIPGEDAESRTIRLTLLRYVNLTIALTFSMVSPAVKRKYPTLNAMVDEGYLTEDEMIVLETLESHTKEHKTWVPIMWACKLVDKARKAELISSDTHQRTVMGEILVVRGKCGEILGWNTYNIPLVYTQVVTIAVYTFFLFSIIGEQFLDPSKNYEDRGIDIYVPVFSFLQLFFYMGWLKVAEVLLNPFGEDDHDFEFLPMMKRHWEMSELLGNPELSDLPHSLVEKHLADPITSKTAGNGLSPLTSGSPSPMETVVTTDGKASFFNCKINGS
ncbi:bestrophin-2-like [Palaemon carinicauda]|uniref:bestrophin-2-like n=1 Tax=Palaemon carinicauda TaxID=392227 RepID=UPI0035B65DA5